MLKQKSRPAGGADIYKHSIHLIVECAGVPAKELASICAEIFRPHAEDLARCKTHQDFAPLDDTKIRAPWIGADVATMKGKTGFATLFSKKKQDDPHSQLVHRVAYVAGARVPTKGNPRPFAPASPHDLSLRPGLSRDEALWLLYQSCYSVPKGYICPLSERAEMLSRAQQIRTAARHHAAPGGGVPPPLGDPSVPRLPEWLASELARAGAYSLRKDAARNYHHNIQHYNQSLASWTAVHVSNGAMPCPASLCLEPPVEHKHRNNGVIVVFDPASPSLIYTRCSNCRVDTKNVNAEVSLLKDSEGRVTQWLELDNKVLGSLKEKAARGATPPVE